MRNKYLVTLLGIFFISNASMAGSDKIINLALIPDKTSGFDKSPFISLLEVELSKLENVKLLERAEIDQIFAEKKLRLSFEIKENQDRQLIGNTLGADAILFIQNPINSGQDEFISTRVIETRTGIIIDNFLTITGQNEDIKNWIDSVLTILAKINAPLDHRYYLSISDIRNEEPGDALNHTASVLTQLLSHDLNTSTDIIILERKQLNYLINERDISGTDVQLPASTIILEGGIRREGSNDDLSVSFRFIGLAGINIKSTSLNVSISEISVARKEICKAVVSALDKTDDIELPTDTAMEAAYFLRRALLAEPDGYPSTQTTFAETALALDEDNIVLRKEVCQIYDNIFSARLPVTSLSNIDKFKACKRSHEISLGTIEKISHLGPRYIGRRIISDIFPRLNNLRSRKQTSYNEEEKEIILKIYELCRKEYELTYDFYKREDIDPQGLLQLLINRMENDLQVIASINQFSENIKSMVIEFENMLKEYSDIISDNPPKTFYVSLMQHFLQSIHSERNEQVKPLLNWLTQRDDPFLQFIGYYGLNQDSPSQKEIDTVTKVLDYIFYNEDEYFSFQDIPSIAISRLKLSGKMESFFDNILTQAENNQTPDILNNRNTILEIIRNAEKPKQIEWSDRILSLVNSYDKYNSPQEQVENIKKILTNYTPVVKEKPAKNIGRWADYAIHSLPIKSRMSHHYYPEWIFSNKQHNEIIIVWRSPLKKQEQDISLYDYYITSIDDKGGSLKQICKLEDLQDITITCSAENAENIFLGTRESGLIVVNRNSSEIYCETNGCPSNEVYSMAYFDNSLYLGFEGAFAKFNPVSHTFDIISSCKAVNARNELDRMQSYYIKTILPGLDKEFLWLELSRTDHRNGFWKYNLETGELNYNFHSSPQCANLNDKGEIVYVFDYGLYVLDNQTGKTKKLPNYQYGSANINRGFLMFGNDVFVVQNVLLSEDGKVNEFSKYYDYLGYFSTGIIAADYDRYGKSTNIALSFIQPKYPIENNHNSTVTQELKTNEDSEINTNLPPKVTNNIVEDANEDNSEFLAIKELVMQLENSQQIVQKSLELAEKYNNQEKYKEAFTLYQIVLENSPEPNQAKAAYIGTAISGIEIGKAHEVETAIDGLLKSDKEFETGNGLLEIAQKYKDAQMFEKAGKLYRYIINNQSQSNLKMNAQIGIVKLCFAQGNLSDANDALDTLFAKYKNNPRLPWAMHSLGEEYYYYQSPALKEAQSIFEPRPVSLTEIFNEEFNDKYTKSRMIFLKAIESLPENPLTPEFYHYVGTCSRELGEDEKALKYYKILLDKYPNYQEIKNIMIFIAYSYQRLEAKGIIPIEESYDLVVNSYQEIIDKYPSSTTADLARNRMERYKQSFEGKLKTRLKQKMEQFEPTN